MFSRGWFNSEVNRSGSSYFIGKTFLKINSVVQCILDKMTFYNITLNLLQCVHALITLNQLFHPLLLTPLKAL